jgi:hypothetical protein
MVLLITSIKDKIGGKVSHMALKDPANIERRGKSLEALSSNHKRETAVMNNRVWVIVLKLI